MSKFFIYALHHAESNRVYVGKTTKGLRRPKEHGLPSHLKQKAHLPIARWIKKRLALGQSYEIVVLEECASAEQLIEAEMFYIAYFRSLGISLLNCSDGGEGLFNPSIEVREKIAASKRGGKASIETRTRMSLAAKNRSEEHRAKLAIVAKNHSPERRAKLLEASHSPESRAKRGLAHRGKTISVETRAKISAAARRSITPERRQKMSQAHLGKRPSPEAQIRQSEGLKAMHAKREPEAVAAHMAKMRARKSTVVSIETRAKISAAGRGKSKSAETRMRMSLASRSRSMPRVRINLIERTV